MALAGAVTFGVLVGFIAIRHRGLARWNTVAGLAIPVLFLVRESQAGGCACFLTRWKLAQHDVCGLKICLYFVYVHAFELGQKPT